MVHYTIPREEEKAVSYKPLKIGSAVFKENEFIPLKYTCDGKNVNPPLDIDHIPAAAKSLAIIVDDPDAPAGIWVHWVIWNVPITHHLKEDDAPGLQGMNDFSKHVYSGPCPPKAMHRYFFKVYALDNKLELPASSNKNDLEKAMSGHILGFGELVGLYKRS